MTAAPPEYVTFPSVLTLAGSWRHPTEIHLCDGTTNEKLFRKSVYLGIFGKGLLGHGSGFQLHRGPSKDDPVLGAVGDKTRRQTNVFHTDPDSIIVLPPYGAQLTDPPQPTTELMTASTVPGPGTEDDGRRSVFMFAMETGMDMKRETFQWRQIGKADDLAIASLGGFKLVRAPKDDDSGKTRNDDDCAKTVNGHEDTLALLKWNRGWLGLPSSFSMEPGTLYFIGDRDQAQLGDRWALMTVLTAVRILDMYMLGRASPEAIHVAKTIGVPEETI